MSTITQLGDGSATVELTEPIEMFESAEVFVPDDLEPKQGEVWGTCITATWLMKKPTEYVCGFLFNTTGDYVVLIKRRPSRSYRPNCWNGVGGKVEPRETPLHAMQREFKEEAGLDVKGWTQYGSLTTDGGESVIYLFYAEESTEVIYRVTTETDETVRPIAVAMVPRLDRMPNLCWLLTMAQSVRHCGVERYHVIEEGRKGF